MKFIKEKYPCEKCLVKAMCKEDCKKRDRYMLIVGILSLFIFYAVGVTSVFFLFLPLAKEQQTLALLSIWGVSSILMLHILRKENEDFHIMGLFISPMFVGWYFITTVMIFLSEKVLNYVESL